MESYFIISDITGYTAFMTGSELDHAQDILKTLFDSLLGYIKPPLIVSNFQGDAILMYLPENKILQSQSLLDSIEGLYCTFAETLERMQRNTICTCRACTNISKLDLKIFVHYGTHILQKLNGREELAGPDVILVHRLMKNSVKEKTDIQAYALFTEQAIQRMHLEEFCHTLIGHQESYEHLGDVNLYVHCLKTVWEERRKLKRILLDPADADIVEEFELPITPMEAWDYVTRSDYRSRWRQSSRFDVIRLSQGRGGIGAVYHCYHGMIKIAEEIVDWQPFEYVTYKFLYPPPVNRAYGYESVKFTPTATGTHLSVRIGKTLAPDKPTLWAGQLAWKIKGRKQNLDVFGKMSEIIQQMIKEETT